MIFSSDCDFRNGALYPSSIPDSAGMISDDGCLHSASPSSDCITPPYPDDIPNGPTLPTVIANGLGSDPAAISDESILSQTNGSSFPPPAFLSTSLVLDRRKPIQEMISSIRNAGKVKVSERGEKKHKRAGFFFLGSERREKLSTG